MAALRIPKAQTAQATARILVEYSVDDLTVEDTPIDDSIEQVFNLKAPEAESAALPEETVA